MLVFFTLYQPLVDRIKLKAGQEAETAKLQAELQKAKNEKLKYDLDTLESNLGTQVTELQAKQQQLNADNTQYVTRLEKLAKDFRRVQQEK